MDGDSATATEAACANLLLFPITNVSKVYLGLRLVKEEVSAGEDRSELFFYLKDIGFYSEGTINSTLYLLEVI